MDANWSTADAWTRYGDHRRRVTDLVAEGAAAGGRLCVLGAGNCNDLDLVGVGERFGEVHLVDLDTEALERALARAGSASGKVRLHGGVDITGIATALAKGSGTSLGDSPKGLAELLTKAREPPPLVRGVGFDVVLSATVLTQITESVVCALGPEHASTLGLVLAARTGHLRLMLDLLAPSGLGVLVTDIVSSATYPELTRVSDDRLHGVMRESIAARNFFTGTNPAAIVESIRCDPALAPHVREISWRGPWRWDVSPADQRLTYALLIEVESRTTESSCR